MRGCPAGVFNYVTGSGSTVGEELITNPGIDGITFTGSFDVGMRIYSSLHPRQVSAAGDPRDGWQEPGHCLAQRQLG